MPPEPTERDWAFIVESYRHLVEEKNRPLQPMLDLVRKIEDSPYAQGTVSRLSIYDLIVAQSESGLREFPRLKIIYDAKNDEFRFTYEDGYNDKKWWRRTAPPDEVFEVLERFFVIRARWFKKTGYSPG